MVFINIFPNMNEENVRINFSLTLLKVSPKVSFSGFKISNDHWNSILIKQYINRIKSTKNWHPHESWISITMSIIFYSFRDNVFVKETFWESNAMNVNLVTSISKKTIQVVAQVNNVFLCYNLVVHFTFVTLSLSIKIWFDSNQIHTLSIVIAGHTLTSLSWDILFKSLDITILFFLQTVIATNLEQTMD